MPADQNEREIENKIKELAGEDNPAALEMIWNNYSSNIYGYLVTILCSRHDADDVMQDLFIKIAENKTLLARAENLGGYLFKMAKNEAFSFMRSRNRREIPADPQDFWLIPNAPEEISNEDVSQVSRALESLPEEQRELVSLKIFKDMTFDAISKLTGISQNTAASRYRYAIENLRKILKGKAI